MKKLTRLLLLLSLLIVLPANGEARQVFVHGKIRWINNTPAEGVTVTLVKGNRVVATTLTNSRGVYVFNNLPGLPRHYVLRIMDRSELLKEQPLPDVAVGSKLADIKVE